LSSQNWFIKEDLKEEVVVKKKKYIGDEPDKDFIERAYLPTPIFLELWDPHQSS
jgi:hypothetical protein